MRASAKSKFTRQETLLTELLHNRSAKAIVTPQYEKFVEYWQKLEDAQDRFLEVTDIDVEEDADGLKYLDGPSLWYRNLVKDYSEFVRKADEDHQADQKMTEESARAIEEESRRQIEARAIEEESRRQIEAEKRQAEEELQKQQPEANFQSA